MLAVAGAVTGGAVTGGAVTGGAVTGGVVPTGVVTAGTVTGTPPPWVELPVLADDGDPDVPVEGELTTSFVIAT